MTRSILLLAAVILLPVSPVRAQEVRVVNEGARVPAEALTALAAQAGREYGKLTVMFAGDVGVVTVRVRPTGVARHLPPADIVIPAGLIRAGRAITAHEITHLVTQGWANGLLKEGLAVYAQDRIGEQPGWPNDGRSIHAVALATITRTEPLVRGPADAAQVLATRNPGKAELRRAAYSVAGSWVTWLIDVKFGGDVARFMATLYRSGDYKKALGQPFKPLRAEWRDYLDRVAS